MSEDNTLNILRVVKREKFVQKRFSTQNFIKIDTDNCNCKNYTFSILTRTTEYHRYIFFPFYFASLYLLEIVIHTYNTHSLIIVL